MRRLLIALLLAAPLLQAAEPVDLGQGLKYLESGDYSKARKVFRQAQGPDCPLCGLYLGIAHYRSKNFTEAQKAFEAELALGAQGPAPALALGYAYLLQSQRLEAAWMERCLALSKIAQASRPEEQLFMAQSLLDAVSKSVYPDALREQGAEQVLALSQAQSGTAGTQNMAGRAWILKAEVAARRKDLKAEEAAMQNAVKAFDQELARAQHAVYLQNSGIAVRLMAELKERKLWAQEKMGPANAQSVALAQEALAGYRASVELLAKAQAAEDHQSLQPRLDKVAALSQHQLAEFQANGSIKKVLGTP
jgi:hypothetical protein